MEPLETIRIYGEEFTPKPTHHRIACRGILVQGSSILLSYETNTDQWFVPGGGLEENETPEECCIREMREETGCAVSIIRPYVTVEEYYGDWLFVHQYFLCQLAGCVKRSPTQEEQENGLEPRWISVAEAMDVFSNYQEYAQIDKMKFGTYYREYRVLNQYINQQRK